MKIVFAGLGVMGAPMAGHLVKAGLSVTGYNRSHDKAQVWAETHGAPVEADFERAVSTADILVLCVGNDTDVRGLVSRAMNAMRSGSLIIDHTTTSAKLARELFDVCASKGIEFVDAPVSGGQAGAVNGQLSIMVGGSANAVERAQTILAPYAKSVTHIGEAGAGQLAKMANQIAITGAVQGVAEALHFTKSAGLDPALVFDAISKGAAGSWQMENRWATMAADTYDFGFAVDWMRKDLGIALDEARSNGAHLSVAALVDQFYSEVQTMGGKRWDTSSLHARLEDRRKKL
ncbi:NAD(P)-dependent oxidoreductase [Asticcacaulis endophyticus]|uniref:3-hydroxyisobutyrate dehydrogenase n=1 Tax=Asticcacaulis endophyticus TaxID=1395890 RepID=A0A918QBG9_9CAUL|nr:NAD(P)-dependent oxidoreductase [Asticcacaulis endophyticus]GGZ40869.1 3-hydroxyisobutyrate dehydrogenase [Asticcacaulis endophyticus]